MSFQGVISGGNFKFQDDYCSTTEEDDVLASMLAQENVERGVSHGGRFCESSWKDQGSDSEASDAASDVESEVQLLKYLRPRLSSYQNFTRFFF